MDYFVMPPVIRPTRHFPNAAIVYANVYAFGPGERLQYPCVMSRMVLWCKAGSGRVTVNGQPCPIESGRYLVLPWRHAIKYEASASDPFFVAGIHLVPDHKPDKRIFFQVAHQENDPLARKAFRRDIPIPALAGLKLGWLEAHAPLTQLLEYIVQVFQRGDPEEAMARGLARQLLYELVLSGQRKEVHDHDVPPEIERLKHYIFANLHRPLSLSHLVEFTRLSPSTIGRLFRAHFHTTPVAWITKKKMEKAKFLLRSRRLSVAEIAVRVGIPDPYYFSKCFKKETGCAPLACRRQTRGI
ncbi:MAG: AraC family transcriptional regulator [Terrimicrobiaceae bacterium]